jgi:hypothetical protein
LTRHAHFVATRADLSPSLFFSQPTNQPSSAGIVTFGEQIIKKEKRNKRKYNGRWEYLSSSFSYSIKWKLLDVSSVAGLSCCYVPFQLYHRWGVPVGRHPSGHAQPTSTSIKEGNKNILFRPTDRVFSPSGLFFFTMKMSGTCYKKLTKFDFSKKSVRPNCELEKNF